MKGFFLLFLLALSFGCVQEQPYQGSEEQTPQINSPTFFEEEIQENKSCYPENHCDSEHFCINGECIPKTSLLPEPSDEEPIFKIVFVQNGMDNETEFNEAVDREVAAFVSATPFKDCPDRLEVQKMFDFCCKNGTVKECAENIFGDFDSVVLLHNAGVYDTDCIKCYGEGTVHISVEGRGLLTHELGHSLFGLWDQYCYWPSENNPNPVDFEEGNCTEVTDKNSWHYRYCSLSPESEEVTPYKCLGNMNSKKGRSIMGSSVNRNPADPGFGFTDEELEIISKKVKCS